MTSTDRARRNKVTPIYVIAGFLGSGKTTLLKRALMHELDRGVKPAVLHDHPRSKDIELQALLSDCICCDLLGEFSEKVGHLVKETKGALLFIETTGLADTGQVVMGVEKALTPYRGIRQSQARLVVIGRRVPWERFLKGLETCLVRPARRKKRHTPRWSGATRSTS